MQRFNINEVVKSRDNLDATDEENGKGENDTKDCSNGLDVKESVGNLNATY